MCRTAAELISTMLECENPEQRKVLKRFFKTGRGEYGEGDEFLGLKVPETRAFAKACRDLPLPEVETLLQSRWHEARLCGFLILVEQYNSRKATAEERDGILNLYLRNARNASNWDLVDLSCYKILGRWLVESTASRTEKLRLMDRLAGSDSLWEQPIIHLQHRAPRSHRDRQDTRRDPQDDGNDEAEQRILLCACPFAKLREFFVDKLFRTVYALDIRRKHM